MRKSKKITVVGSTVAILFAGGIAFAAWTSTGTGDGTVTAGDDVAMTVTASSVDALYPGKSVDIDVTVENNDSYKLDLDAITSNGISVDAAHPGCDTASVSSTDGDYSVSADPIAEGASVTRTLVVSMDADADEDCKNAVFTLTYDASAHSVS